MNKTCYFNLTTYSLTGGIENYNKTFIKALSAIDGNITSVSVHDREEKGNIRGVEYKNFFGNKYKASMFVLLNIKKIERLYVAHVNLLPIAMIAKIINPKVDVFLNVYGVEVWKKLPFIVRKFISRIKVISISNYTTSKLVEFNHVKKENVFYLPPDTNATLEHDSHNVYETDKFNLLSVTRLDSVDNYKGVDSVIYALARLVESNHDIRYTVIGKGDDKERLVSLVKSLQLERFVRFEGYVDSIEPYYEHCDTFILPSKGEGFGIVYIEAMKYEKPCIACNEGGQTDVVKHNETGYLCTYDDNEEISEYIMKLYKDRESCKKLGRNGKSHYLNNFTYMKFEERLRKIASPCR